MADEDIFDLVQAPSWAESLQMENDNYDEDDDNFFPSGPAVEKITAQMEQLAVVQPSEEDPEDLSRMAMFGNRKQVKRRSQIRREMEASSQQPVQKVPSRPPTRPSSIPSSRSSSIPRALSVTRATTPKPVTAPSVAVPAIRTTGPVTRSQAKLASNTPIAVPNERKSRDMGRNATTVKRHITPSPTPNQVDFNRALSQRAGSLGNGVRTPLAAPANPRVPVRPPTATRAPVPRPVPAATKPNPVARVRAPITVTKSPQPNLAFGSSVAPKPKVARTSAIRPQQEARATPQVRPAPLRVYPAPSGATPARSLTLPKTPVVAKRPSSVTRAPTARAPVAAAPQTPRTIDRKVLKPRDIQGMVDRLSKPKTVTSVTRPSTLSTPKRTIPNTYTHGITTTVKMRSRSNSRPPSQNENVNAIQ